MSKIPWVSFRGAFSFGLIKWVCDVLPPPFALGAELKLLLTFYVLVLKHWNLLNYSLKAFWDISLMLHPGCGGNCRCGTQKSLGIKHHTKAAVRVWMFTEVGELGDLLTPGWAASCLQFSSRKIKGLCLNAHQAFSMPVVWFLSVGYQVASLCLV